MDARSDIFSFGAMLYEMVTGMRAFAGTSMADTLAAVLRGAADAARARSSPACRAISRGHPALPAQGSGRGASSTCVDVKVALQEIKDESTSATFTATPAIRLRKHRGLMVAAAASAVVLVAAASWYLRQGALPSCRRCASCHLRA